MPAEIVLGPDDPDQIGGYRVLGRLAQGGQGVVYLAQAPSGERVAVKLLRASWLADPAARDRLIKEVAAARQVARFATAEVIEARVEGDAPFIVSEFVDGPSLTEQVRDRGPLSGAALERLAVGTATALVSIHQAGIVHRDFKPSNVMLGPDGPRVIDFGIARDLARETTITDRIFCTPAYASPEQISGKPVGPPADVFAWACTLVFAATGEGPFRAEDPTALMYQILHCEPRLAALPTPLADLLARCLAKDPAVRPTAGQALEELFRRFRPPHEDAPAAGMPAHPARPEESTAVAIRADPSVTVSRPLPLAAAPPRQAPDPFRINASPSTLSSSRPQPPAAPSRPTQVIPRPTTRPTARDRRRTPRHGLPTGGAVLAATLATILLLAVARHPGLTWPGATHGGSGPASSSTPGSGAMASPGTTPPGSSTTQPDSATTSPAATSQTATGLVIPATFDGTWKGTTRAPLGTFSSAAIGLTMTTGARLAQINNQTLGCSGTLEVVQPQPTDRMLHLHLRVSLDPTHWCVLPLTPLTVMASGPDTLTLSWHDAFTTNNVPLTRST